jgi:hypothetical protein
MTVGNGIRLAGAAGLALLALPAPGSPVARDTLPSVEEVLSRHVEAAGGRARLEKVTTLVMTGTLATPGGTAPLEIHLKAPGKFYRRLDSPASGLSEIGSDGAVAWSANARGVREMQGPEVESAKREYDLRRPLRFRESYPHLALAGRERIAGGELYRIEARSGDGTLEVFHFDSATWRLSRWDVTLGGTTLRTIYEDFRAVEGVVLPFTWLRSRPDFAWTETFSEIRVNVPVEDGRFEKPRGG